MRRATLAMLALVGAGAYTPGAPHPCGRRTCIRSPAPLLLAADADPPQTPRPPPAARPEPPPVALLMVVAGLQSACFGCIGTALAPALRASGLAPAAIALLLGRLGSTSALIEVLLSNSFGRLADAVGRKPIMLAAPAITIAARGSVILSPTIPVLIISRLVTTIVVPIYWLAYQAAMADLFGNNTTRLAVVNSRVSAGMGLGYAIASLVGGPLAARDIRYAYAASCAVGCCVLACITFGFGETLTESRRVPFRENTRASSPLGCANLFRRGRLFGKLNAINVCQSITGGMGDLWQARTRRDIRRDAQAAGIYATEYRSWRAWLTIWQVLARELRGWGAAQCGRYAAVAGLASMIGTLLTGPSIRRLGPRGHTVAATGASASASLILGRATSDAVAFGGVVPMALGSGKGMATSARITNLGEELGVPQGQLAAERSTLNALIKVVAPSLYAWLFAFGSSRGVIGLPFYATAALMCVSAAIAASISPRQWSSPNVAGPGQEKPNKGH